MLNLISMIKRFIEVDNEHKRYQIRTLMNHLMGKIGKNNQFDYFELRSLNDRKELVVVGTRKVPVNKIVPFDMTHNLVCPYCKIKFFDLTGKAKVIDIRKSVCPFYKHTFNGLDRKHWSMKSENLEEHLRMIEAMKKSMKSGWKPPPVELYFDTKTGLYYKLEGFKRMIANIELHKKSIDAIVFHKN